MEAEGKTPPYHSGMKVEGKTPPYHKVEWKQRERPHHITKRNGNRGKDPTISQSGMEVEGKTPPYHSGMEVEGKTPPYHKVEWK